MPSQTLPASFCAINNSIDAQRERERESVRKRLTHSTQVLPMNQLKKLDVVGGDREGDFFLDSFPDFFLGGG